MSVCYFSLPAISSVTPRYWDFMTDYLKEPVQLHESAPSRGGSARSSYCDNVGSSFHIKRLENAALHVLLALFPDGTQRCALWAEKNATQMTLSPEAEVLRRASRSEAQPKSSQRTEVGLSIALTYLSE